MLLFPYHTVCIHMKKELFKTKQLKFWTELVKVSDCVKNYVMSLMFQGNHWKILGKLLNQLKLGFKHVALYCKSILKHYLI